jgi:hypothetical protein
MDPGARRGGIWRATGEDALAGPLPAPPREPVDVAPSRERWVGVMGGKLPASTPAGAQRKQGLETWGLDTQNKPQGPTAREPEVKVTMTTPP